VNDDDIREAGCFCVEYEGPLGSATTEAMTRVDDRSWRAFFARPEEDSAARPPGHWGNEDEGRDLRISPKNRACTPRWGRYSRVELAVGRVINPEYGLAPNERPRVPVRGNPTWSLGALPGIELLSMGDGESRWVPRQARNTRTRWEPSTVGTP
jgi:putative transposase